MTRSVGKARVKKQQIIRFQETLVKIQKIQN